MIDILVPVLGRPGNAQPLVDSIRDNTEVSYRITFLVTPDDRDEVLAVQKTGQPYIRSPQPGYAHKMNLGASLTGGEFIFLGADDIRFHPGWDHAAIDRYHETGCAVVGTNDLGNPTVMAGRHATHLLVHRSYLPLGTIDEPGKLLHEGYGHNWVDTEFIETAKKRGQWTFAKDSHVEHLHPFWQKGKDDPIYAKGRSSNAADMRLFNQRRKLWR